MKNILETSGTELISQELRSAVELYDYVSELYRFLMDQYGEKFREWWKTASEQLDSLPNVLMSEYSNGVGAGVLLLAGILICGCLTFYALGLNPFDNPPSNHHNTSGSGLNLGDIFEKEPPHYCDEAERIADKFSGSKNCTQNQ